MRAVKFSEHDTLGDYLKTLNLENIKIKSFGIEIN